MTQQLKTILIISAKHAVNAILTNAALIAMFHQFFGLYSWKVFEHMLGVAVATVASREAMVWLPKILKWSSTGLQTAED